MFYEQAKRSYELNESNFLENIENNHEIVRLILKELHKNLIIITSGEKIDLTMQARTIQRHTQRLTCYFPASIPKRWRNFRKFGKSLPLCPEAISRRARPRWV